MKKKSKKETEQDLYSKFYPEVTHEEWKRQTSPEAIAEDLRKAKEEEKELLAELEEAGIKVDSVWDLVNRENNYPEALPILANHIAKPYTPKTLEGIVSALTVKEARGLVDNKLPKLFKEIKDHCLRGAIGNAIAVVSTEKDLDSIILLLEDRESYGEARYFLIEAIARIQRDKSIPLIMSYLDDPYIYHAAIKELGKLKAVEAKEAIEQFTTDEDSDTRKLAKAALKKIQGKLDKSKKKT